MKTDILIIVVTVLLTMIYYKLKDIHEELTYIESNTARIYKKL